MSDDALITQLAAVDLFAGLPDKVLKRIAQDGNVEAFGAGTHVTEEGSAVAGWAPFSPQGVRFYLILDGSAGVEVHGKSVGEMSAGQYFGETSLIDGEPRSATVVAGSGGMRAFTLTAWAFSPILKENPAVALALLKVLAARLRAAESRASA